MEDLQRQIEENGSVLIADGKIFSLLSEKGVLRLVRASPDAYQELASARVCAGRQHVGPDGPQRRQAPHPQGRR